MKEATQKNKNTLVQEFMNIRAKPRTHHRTVQQQSKQNLAALCGME